MEAEFKEMAEMCDNLRDESQQLKKERIVRTLELEKMEKKLQKVEENFQEQKQRAEDLEREHAQLEEELADAQAKLDAHKNLGT